MLQGVLVDRYVHVTTSIADVNLFVLEVVVLTHYMVHTGAAKAPGSLPLTPHDLGTQGVKTKFEYAGFYFLLPPCRRKCPVIKG